MLTNGRAYGCQGAQSWQVLRVFAVQTCQLGELGRVIYKVGKVPTEIVLMPGDSRNFYKKVVLVLLL